MGIDRRVPVGDLAVAMLGLLLLVLWDASGLDRVVVAWFGTDVGFPLRDAWVTSGLLHQGGRGLAWLLLAILAIDAVRRRAGPPARGERLRWFTVTLVCLLLVPWLKQLSHTSCPWDLQAFGGVARYIPHWRLGDADGGPGRCFPSGHATAAFAFLTGYFLWRRDSPAFARMWLAGVVLCGLVFGVVQIVRGAHYPSHVLWSAWLCWVICTVADRARHFAQPSFKPVILLSTGLAAVWSWRSTTK